MPRNALREVLTELGIQFTEERSAEAAFYGPEAGRQRQGFPPSVPRYTPSNC